VLPDLADLRLLTDIARLGSITAAGRLAGVSQQSASARLRSMERSVGLALVMRTTTGATLTPEGRLLVEWSAELLRCADEAETALGTLRAKRSQQLHVHASMTTAEFLLPGWLVRLRQRGRVAVSLQAENTDAVVAAVRSGGADLGFIEGPASIAGLASAVVGADELVLVASPTDAWARRRVLRPATIAERPLTSREPGSGTRRVSEDAAARAGVTLAMPEVELTTTAAVLAAVRAGGAPAFVSRRAVARDVEAGLLVEVPTTDLDLHRSFTAVWAGANPPPRGPIRDLLAIALA
jgi:molybdate transport repressor ModE-like protein